MGGWSKNGEYQEQMEFCALSGQSGREDGRMRGLSPARAVLGTPVKRPRKSKKKKKISFFFFILLTDSINLDH